MDTPWIRGDKARLSKRRQTALESALTRASRESRSIVHWCIGSLISNSSLVRADNGKSTQSYPTPHAHGRGLNSSSLLLQHQPVTYYVSQLNSCHAHLDCCGWDGIAAERAVRFQNYPPVYKQSLCDRKKRIIRMMFSASITELWVQEERARVGKTH